MANFIETGTLAGPYKDRKILPAGADPDLVENLRAARLNELRAALMSVREAIFNGALSGITAENMYPDTATALAAVAEGAYFTVPSFTETESLILYRKSSGAAAEVSRYPSALIVAAAESARNAAAASASAAATSSTAASAAQAGAETARVGAEAARDAALAAGKIYPDTTTALAAEAEGAYFSVPSSSANESFIHYRKESGAAVEVKRYPSLSGLHARSVQAIRSHVGVVNVFDPAAITLDRLINSGSGTLGTSTGYYVTGFIPVEPGGYVTFNQTPAVASGYGPSFYDESQAYLSTGGLATAGAPLAVPAGAYYMRATLKTANNPSTSLMIVQGQALPTAFLPFGLPKDVASPGMIRDYRPATVNLLDKSRRTPNTAIATSGSVESLSGYSVTNFIPVTPGGTFTTYPAQTNIISGYAAQFYDAAKNRIGAGTDTPYTAGQVHSVPAGAYYMRLTLKDTQLDSFLVLDGTQTPVVSSEHIPAMKSDISPWTRKVFAIHGDSISANTNWMATVAAQLGATVGLNATRVGRKMINALMASDDVTPLAASDYTTIDMAVLWLGTNDFSNATPLGTLADPTSSATFYSQLKLAVETILGWKPSVRLLLGTPLWRSTALTANAQGLLLSDYARAVRDVAERYALPVIDFSRTSGLNAVNLGTYTSDGLHPNAAGYAANVVPTALGALRSVLPTS